MRRGQLHSAIPDDRRGLLLTIVSNASAPGQMQRADIGLVDLLESRVAIASVCLGGQNPVIVVFGKSRRRVSKDSPDAAWTIPARHAASAKSDMRIF
jgi:hypothetical protein